MVEQGPGVGLALGMASTSSRGRSILQPSTRCKTSFRTSFRLSNSRAFVIDSKYPRQALVAIVQCELLQDRTVHDN